MKASPQIVIDLETLDVQHSAIIVTAAAVEIDPVTDDILREFYVRLDLDQPDRTRNFEIEQWWSQQSVEAYAEAFRPHERCPLPVALRQISNWVNESDAPIWGNGSDFDNAILNSAFAQHGLSWPFPRNRCLRTLIGLVKEQQPDLSSPPFNGIKHHALHDARHEAFYLSTLIRAFSI